MDTKKLAIQIGAASIVSFGLIFWVFAIAYSGDVASVVQAPLQIWQFVCGIPPKNSMTVPLLLSIGTIAILSGSGALWWQSRRG
jgi:hypothetical protein